MTLTIEMLLTRFFQEHPEAKSDFTNGEKQVAGVRLLPTDHSTLSPDFLYVSDHYSKEKADAIPSDVPVVFFSTKESNAPDSPTSANIILINHPFELAHGFNDLQQAANTFLNWERNLEFSVFKGDNFQDLIDLSSDMILSAMLVYDPALKLLAWSKNQSSLKDQMFQTAVKNGYLDINNVRYFEEEKTFERIHEKGASHGEVDGVREHADYIRSINIQNHLTVYCILLFTDKLPRSYERQLFDILCDAFYQILVKQHTTFLRDRSVTDYFLMDLLDNPETSEQQIRERILYHDLDYDGSYIMFSIYSDVRKKSAEQFFLHFLRNNMIHCHIFPYKDCVIVLYRLPPSEHLSYREYMTKQLMPLLEAFSNNQPRAFISKPFSCIRDFAGAYQQAESTRLIIENASDAGVKTTDSIFFYDDYWIRDLIIGNPTANKSFFYCEPCLLDLVKKDTKKSRQQFMILKEYLNCDRNYTNVAATLHMHRNNVIYHIKNIEEQYHLDLDDAKTRLKLLLSFEMIDL